MAQEFNANFISRKIQIELGKEVDRRIQQRVKTAVDAVRNEQRRMFSILANSFVGAQREPARLTEMMPFQWPELDSAWRRRKEKRWPGSGNKFFEGSGDLKATLGHFDGSDFGQVKVRSGEGRGGGFISKDWRERRYNIYYLDGLKRYPNFKGIEWHPLMRESGIGKKLVVRGKVKRPLLQPFFMYWSKRLQIVIERAVNRNNPHSPIFTNFLGQKGK